MAADGGKIQAVFKQKFPPQLFSHPPSLLQHQKKPHLQFTH